MLERLGFSEAESIAYFDYGIIKKLRCRFILNTSGPSEMPEVIELDNRINPGFGEAQRRRIMFRYMEDYRHYDYFHNNHIQILISVSSQQRINKEYKVKLNTRSLGIFVKLKLDFGVNLFYSSSNDHYQVRA
jgi:hypothetical protein